MARLKKEYHELLEETVKFYGEDSSRRGIDVNGSTCAYITKDESRRCAVGRCMTLKAVRKLKDKALGVSGVVQKYTDDNLDELLLVKYKGFEKGFWVELQNFHDSSTNFKGSSLSETGRKKVDNIRFRIDEYTYTYSE